MADTPQPPKPAAPTVTPTPAQPIKPAAPKPTAEPVETHPAGQPAPQQTPTAPQPHAPIPGVPDHQEIPVPPEAHSPEPSGRDDQHHIWDGVEHQQAQTEHPAPLHDANTISAPPGPADMRKIADDRDVSANYLHPVSSSPEVVNELGDPPPVLSPLGRQRLDALASRQERQLTDDEKKEMVALRKVDEDHVAYVKRYHEMTDKKAAGPFSVEQWRHLKTWMRRELAMHIGGHTEESRKVLNP